MTGNKVRSILFALLAAVFFAVSVPCSKLLLEHAGPTTMAALLYLGAGLGVGIMSRIKKPEKTERLTKGDLPFVIGMIVLDIAAPVFLMLGVSQGSSGNASLLGNFEIVATTLIALLVFKETVSMRLWCAILLITLSSILLSFNGTDAFQFSYGSLYVLLATVCWGFENNCTRRLSSKDPLQIVMVKGIFSGIGSITIGFLCGERILHLWTIPVVLLLGFVAYGLSIYFYVYAQRILGAARTSAYYAVAPFIGVFLSLLIFREIPGILFIAALLLMIIGAWLSSQDKPLKETFRRNQNRSMSS